MNKEEIIKVLSKEKFDYFDKRNDELDKELKKLYTSEEDSSSNSKETEEDFEEHKKMLVEFCNVCAKVYKEVCEFIDELKGFIFSEEADALYISELSQDKEICSLQWDMLKPISYYNEWKNVSDKLGPSIEKLLEIAKKNSLEIDEKEDDIVC